MPAGWEIKRSKIAGLHLHENQGRRKIFSGGPCVKRQGKKRLGLLGMRERLEMVGGHFDIESVAGQRHHHHGKHSLRTKTGGGNADGAR